ncbi:MAG: nitrate reductase molybdenum cofactor assembly chaperone [Magnetococcus sp. MYC-9]
MMSLFAILSALLDYPTTELQGALGEIRLRTETANDLEDAERQAILALLATLEECSIVELQSRYVEIFDLNPDHSLHLTHHLLGDDNRERGPALIQLASHFCQQGWEIHNGELPDFLPLLLEFAAQLPLQDAESFLAEAVPALAILAGNLERHGHPAHAALVRLVERRGRRALATA